jgi:phasin family protein
MCETQTTAGDGTTSATDRIREVLGRYRLPGFDLEGFLQARQADIDAMSRATSVAFAGAQTITDKQIDLLKATLTQLSEAVPGSTSASSGTDAGDAVEKQRELVQSTLSRTLEGMKEMAEAAQRAQAEIFDIALERARSNAERLRSLFTLEKK